MDIRAVLYRGGILTFLSLLFMAGTTADLYAQVNPTRPDSAMIDSLRNARAPQTGAPQQGPPGGAPGQGGPPGAGGQQPEQEGQVNFSARDSMVFNFHNQRNGTLYGQSKVVHSAGNLSAGKISLNLNKHLVSANTQNPEDSLSQPVLTREQDKIRSNSISFNYQTEEGRFEVARMQMEGKNLIGEKVKNVDRNTIFIEDAIYSTCTLDHPHYYIKAHRMKVVDQDEVFFTSARLYILDIPYPLVFPFGYIPTSGIKQKQSGLLEPTYTFQENSSRGLGLQNLGWFQYFNDHLVGQASVDIFTSGTFYLDASSSYRFTDRYNGQVQIGYSRENSSMEPTDPNYQTTVQKRISINHSQTISPYANFSANINYRTADYFKRNSYDPNDRASTNTSSSLNYRYNHPENLYNFSVSARQNQNFKNNRVSLSAPNMSFNLREIKPFASDNTRNEPSLLESLSIGYDNRLEGDYEFNPIRGDSARINWLEALFDPAKYREATGNNDHFRYAFQQNADISVSNVLPSRFIHLNLSGRYSEYWFPSSIRKTFNPDSNRVETRTVRGFNSAREFSTSASMNTTFYGMWNQKIGNIAAFRHKVTPSLSFSYSPNFQSDFWGYYREVQADTTGRTRNYSIFENEIFRGPSGREQLRLGFNVGNVFEAKQVKRDSLGEKNERNLRLGNLNMSSSYNFAADSLKLSDMNMSFSTNVVEGLNIRANANFNFYQRDADGRKIDKYLWQAGKIPEMTNFRISASTSFDGGTERGIQLGEPNYPAQYNPLNQRIFHGFDPHFNQRPVQPLKSPWRVSFDFNYNWRLNPGGKASKSATINANRIEFRLTPKWRFSTSLGYDFVQKELTPTRFSLQRDLHCWNLSFEMNPFGEFQYFFFRLSVDSSQLSGIFQKLPGLNNLQRSSSPSGRGNTRYGGF